MMKGYGYKRSVRAVSLIMATLLMVTCTPVSILADEEQSKSDTGEIIIEVEKSDASADSNLNSDGSVNEGVGEVQSVDIAIDAVEDAQASTNTATGVQSSEPTGDLLRDLSDPTWTDGNGTGQIMPAEQAVAATDQDLNDLWQAMADGEAAEDAAKTSADTINASLSPIVYEAVPDENGNSKMTPVISAVKSTADTAALHADSAVQNAEKANSSDSEDEAAQAASSAGEDLKNAEEGLANSLQELATAEDNLKKANDDYKEASNKFAAAKSAAESAQRSALDGAIKDSAAAVAALEAAEQKAKTLQEEMFRAYTDVENSEYSKICAAYDALYGEDGLVTKNPDTYKTDDVISKSYSKLVRKLCNSIIEYSILKDEKVSIGGDIIFKDMIEKYDKDGTEKEGDLIWQKYKAVKVDYVDEENENGMTDGWVRYREDNDPDKNTCVKATIYRTDGNGDIMYDNEGEPVVKETKYYGFAKDDDGKIRIFERSIDVEQEKSIEKKDAVAEVQYVPAHYESNGVKYDESQYTHSAVLEKDGDPVAVYAIDDDESRLISSKAVKVKNESNTSEWPNYVKVYKPLSGPDQQRYTAVIMDGDDKTPAILKSDEKQYEMTTYVLRMGIPREGFKYFPSKQEAESFINGSGLQDYLGSDWIIINAWVALHPDDGCYYAHHQVFRDCAEHVSSKSTSQVYKAVNETLYRADAYNYVPEVEHKDPVIGNKEDLYIDKVVYESEDTALARAATNGTLVDKTGYESEINDYREKLANYKTQADAYRNALKEVTAAKEKAVAIQNKINALKEKGIVEVDRSELDALEKKLAEAQTAYDNSKKKVEELSGKVEEARTAVASIDLSRFEKSGKSTSHSSSDSSSDTADTSTGAFIYNVPAPVADLAGLIVQPIKKITGRLSSKRTVAREESGNSEPERTDKTDEPQSSPALTVTGNDKSDGVTTDNTDDIVKLDDNRVPLADTPEMKGLGMQQTGFMLAGVIAAIAIGGLVIIGTRKKW